MKKIAAILFTVVLLANKASAKDGFYVGADVLKARAIHTYEIKYGNYPQDKLNSHSNSTGFALDFGYKFSVNEKVFIAPEIFYDHLGNSANDFYYDSNPANYQDRMNVTNRYGGKVNLGFNVTPKFAVFVNAGIANVMYNISAPSVHNPDSPNFNGGKDSRGSHKIAPLYGLGASYTINDQWAVRASYDKQSFNIQYIVEGLRSKVDLTVTKLGLVYSF